jgi:hypothetical protein
MSVGDVMESILGLNQPTKYLGKYRGTVINNLDPMQLGRIQALVPDVSSTLPTSWAMPCLPVAGIQMGVCVVPPLNAGVWIEFEQGDPDKPVWSGAWYGSVADVPAPALAAPPAVPNIVLQTTAQNTIMLSDLPGPAGGILLKCRSGAFISVSDNGIIISNGVATITLLGPTVDINMSALTIT